jgi:hypothetical protein
MFARTVTGIEYVAIDIFGKHFRRPWAGVSNDHRIDMHRFDIFRRVDDSFPFSQTACCCGEIDYIGSESPGSEGKTDFGASGIFKEQIDARFAGKQRDFPTPPPLHEHGVKSFGLIEQ